MKNVTVFGTCWMTGKIMLTKREAGDSVRLAKRCNSGKEIPKGIFLCSLCRTYHTTHFSKSNAQRKKNAGKYLSPYKRSDFLKLRIYDYMDAKASTVCAYETM